MESTLRPGTTNLDTVSEFTNYLVETLEKNSHVVTAFVHDHSNVTVVTDGSDIELQVLAREVFDPNEEYDGGDYYHPCGRLSARSPLPNIKVFVMQGVKQDILTPQAWVMDQFNEANIEGTEYGGSKFNCNLIFWYDTGVKYRVACYWKNNIEETD